MGVCKGKCTLRVANPSFDRCRTQFETGQVKICELYLELLENNCKSACKRAILLQVCPSAVLVPLWTGPLKGAGPFGALCPTRGSARHGCRPEWQILCLTDAGPNLGREEATFVDCVWQFWKRIAREHASGPCYCKSRVSSSACTQLDDRGVHVSS